MIGFAKLTNCCWVACALMMAACVSTSPQGVDYSFRYFSDSSDGRCPDLTGMFMSEGMKQSSLEIDLPPGKSLLHNDIFLAEGKSVRDRVRKAVAVRISHPSKRELLFEALDDSGGVLATALYSSANERLQKTWKCNGGAFVRLSVEEQGGEALHGVVEHKRQIRLDADFGLLLVHEGHAERKSLIFSDPMRFTVEARYRRIE
jgi:hypothetical protein